MAVGTDVEGAVLMIVTCASALKALGEGGSRATRDGNIEEVGRSRDDGTIVAELHDKRAVSSHSIIVKAVFRVDGGKRGRSVGRGW